MKYYRYCSDRISPHTGQRYGIFISVWHLVRDGKITVDEEFAYWEARKWFEEHLPIPPYYREGNPDKAITWFKESAMEGSVVRKLDLYRNLAEKYGTTIELISSESPGPIVYEDDFQIAVISEKDFA